MALLDARFAKQIMFSPIGEEGQLRLQSSHVVVIGCGALGSTIAETLVRAGVGTLTIADRDYVEQSNLQRQQLFTEQDAIDGVPKVIAAQRRLQSIRSDIQIHPVLDHVDGPLLESLAQDADVLMDATDNFETRLLLNDIAWKKGIPWIYGACVGSTSTVFPFIPGETPCFRCFLPVLPAVNETCDTSGIIAPAAQMTAAYQCTEALKWLTGNRSAMRQQLLHLDIWHGQSIELGLGRLRRKNCASCGETPTYPTLQANEEASYAVLCGREAVQVIPSRHRSISVVDGELVAQRLGSPIRKTPYFVEFYAEGYRCVLFANGRLFIHGLKELQAGRKLYHQLFG